MAAIASTRIQRLQALSPRTQTAGLGAGLSASWSQLTSRPANLAALSGSEAIKNTDITLDAYGRITGIGSGALTPVSNAGITLSSSGQLTYTTPSGPVNIGSTTLSGLGAGNFAWLNVLTSGNIGSYLAASAIGSYYISDLAANKITAGTLAAGVVYAGEVAANKITAGTLAAGVVYAGYLSASQFTAGTVNISSYGSLSMGGIVKPIMVINRTSTTSLEALWINDSNTGSSGPLVRISGGAGSTSFVVEQSSAGYLGAQVKNTGSSKTVSFAGTSYSVYSNAGEGKFYAVDGIGPFTGFHDALIRKSASTELGDIVIDEELIYKTDVSNTTWAVRLSDTPAQPGAIGVVSDRREVDQYIGTMPYVTWWEYEHTHDVLSVNGAGEGQINVCGEGGDIAVGDLIVTSSLPGKGMKQADDIVRAVTVAKAREACVFTTPGETKQIACIYLCG